MTGAERLQRDMICEFVYGIYLVLAGWEYHPAYTQKYRMIGELRTYLRNYDIDIRTAINYTMQGYSWTPSMERSMMDWLLKIVDQASLIVCVIVNSKAAHDPSVLRRYAVEAMQIEISNRPHGK